MIKLIMSDVDRTLVPDGSPDLGPEVFGITLGLREKGMQFAVVSGCPQASVESTFEPIEKKTFCVANSGAYVGCHGRCLYAYTMDRQLAHRVIRKVRMHPELEMAYTGVNGDHLDSKSGALYGWSTSGYKFNAIRVKDVLELREPCVRVSIYKKEGIEAAARGIYGEFRDRAKMTCVSSMWIDCMARDANKGRIVRTIQESLGIKVEEIMASGDQLNDIGMLNQAYYNLVATDAREKVRRVARFQANGNVWGGVLRILKGLLREEHDSG